METTPRQSLGIAALYEQVARAVYDKTRDADLQPAQWSALRFFERAGEDARTVTGLAMYQGITKGPASRTVATLLRRGLLTSRRHAEDGRMMIFTLTDCGRELVKYDPLKAFAKQINELPVSERECLSRALINLSIMLGLSSDF